MPVPLTTTLLLAAALILAAGSDIGAVVLAGLAVLNQLVVVLSAPTGAPDDA